MKEKILLLVLLLAVAGSIFLSYERTLVQHNFVTETSDSSGD